MVLLGPGAEPMSELIERTLVNFRKVLELEARKLKAVTLCLLISPLLASSSVSGQFGVAGLLEETARRNLFFEILRGELEAINELEAGLNG